MNNLGVLFLCILVYLMSAGNVAAHVQLDYPAGGESFVFGQMVDIQWHILIPHEQENWDLYFSTNSGETWEIIELNLNTSQLNYQWIVPQTATEYARIRIDMDNTTTDYSDMSGNIIIRDPLSLQAAEKNIPNTVILHANYPNPFNPSTTISYELPLFSSVELTIYNQLGQEIRTLVREEQPPDLYRIQWDGCDNGGNPVVSGIYIYRLTADSFSRSRKMVLLR